MHTGIMKVLEFRSIRVFSRCESLTATRELEWTFVSKGCLRNRRTTIMSLKSCSNSTPPCSASPIGGRSKCKAVIEVLSDVGEVTKGLAQLFIIPMIFVKAFAHHALRDSGRVKLVEVWPGQCWTTPSEMPLRLSCKSAPKQMSDVV